MEKLKKVIAGLVACNGVGEDCKNCPYHSEREKCSDMLNSDALAVLKEMDGKYAAAIEMAAIATEKLAARSSGDLISRELTLERLKGVIARTGMYGTSIEVILGAIPAVEAEPVVHAHWIRTDFVSPVWKCSNCGRQINRVSVLDYYRCPECGAHMDEEVAE